MRVTSRVWIVPWSTPLMGYGPAVQQSTKVAWARSSDPAIEDTLPSDSLLSAAPTEVHCDRRRVWPRSVHRGHYRPCWTRHSDLGDCRCSFETFGGIQRRWLVKGDVDLTHRRILVDNRNRGADSCGGLPCFDPAESTGDHGLTQPSELGSLEWSQVRRVISCSSIPPRRLSRSPRTRAEWVKGPHRASATR